MAITAAASTRGIDAIEARVPNLDKPLTMIRSDDLRALLAFARAGIAYAESMDTRRHIAQQLEDRTVFVRAAKALRDGA